jgi:uncharacterized BrkB/YihY/UPF0761 family membrane protein
MNTSIWTRPLEKIPIVRFFLVAAYVALLLVIAACYVSFVVIPELRDWTGWHETKAAVWLWFKASGVILMGLTFGTVCIYAFLPDHQTRWGHRALILWLWVECLVSPFLAVLYCVWRLS